MGTAFEMPPPVSRKVSASPHSVQDQLIPAILEAFGTSNCCRQSVGWSLLVTRSHLATTGHPNSRPGVSAESMGLETPDAPTRNGGTGCPASRPEPKVSRPLRPPAGLMAMGNSVAHSLPAWPRVESGAESVRTIASFGGPRERSDSAVRRAYCRGMRSGTGGACIRIRWM